MRSLLVVVLGVGPERLVEMPPTEDERPVEALGPHRLDHALGVRVGVRGPDRRSDHPVGVRYSDSNHAARPWYSWMSPPSRSRRRPSRGLTGTGTLATPRGVARRMAR